MSWIRKRRKTLDRPGVPRLTVKGRWEHLAEASAREIFDFHLQRNFESIPREAGETDARSLLRCYRKVAGACYDGNHKNQT